MTGATTSNTTSEDKNLEQLMANFRASDDDLMEEAIVRNGALNSGAGDSPVSKRPKPFRFIPLRMGGSGGTHQYSSASRELIKKEVSLAQLTAMTEAFYSKAFQDRTIDKFIRSHEDAHGARFAKWIHQKLSGSDIWDRDRQTRNLEPVEVAGGRTTVVHDRSSAHVAAWHSPKRPKREVGRHFKLDECRVWMRLHFWAMRETGIVEASPTFANYYVRFIGHFIRVYESSAPPFTRDSFRWSADPKNIEKYIKNGRQMNDVLGLTFQQAMKQIPQEEFDDAEWPYNQS